MSDPSPEAPSGPDAGVAAVLGRTARRAGAAAAVRRLRRVGVLPPAALPDLPVRPAHVDRRRRAGHRVHASRWPRSRPHPPFADEVPQLLAVVELAEGVRVSTTLVDVEPARDRASGCPSRRCSTTATTASPCCASAPRPEPRASTGARPSVVGDDPAMGYLEDRAGLQRQGGGDRRRRRWTRPRRRARLRPSRACTSCCVDRNEELLDEDRRRPHRRDR